jgi:hypothetical protein
MRQKEEMRKEKEVARLKAANERAIARKIAKESMELIEDERLELMEVAALTKGLPSMLALDFETLQNLDEYRDKQAIFPPTSVKLKKPFAVKPWNGSDENVANLLMVTFPILSVVKFFHFDVNLNNSIYIETSFCFILVTS